MRNSADKSQHVLDLLLQRITPDCSSPSLQEYAAKYESECEKVLCLPRTGYASARREAIPPGRMTHDVRRHIGSKGSSK